MGCASIVHGTKQPVSINSTPTQADFEVKTEGGTIVFQGKTPATATLERKNSYDVTINLAGYQEARIHISKEFDPLFLGNLLCGGVIGMIVDASNGAMNKLTPESINVTLVTASIENGAKEVYAVCRIIDDEGQLKTMVIPLIKS